MEFIVAYFLFGPIVAIPLAWGTMPLEIMMLQGILSQSCAIVLTHWFLESVDYTKEHKRAIVEKFALFTKKELGEVRRNTEEISSRFYARFGHLGYYLSLIFFAFTLGVLWSAVIAFALRLRTFMSGTFICIGSVLAFLFWYWVYSHSLSYIATDIAFVLAVGISFTLLFYGQVRERQIMSRIRGRLRRS